jgi:hypothetical protein
MKEIWLGGKFATPPRYCVAALFCHANIAVVRLLYIIKLGGMIALLHHFCETSIYLDNPLIHIHEYKGMPY